MTTLLMRVGIFGVFMCAFVDGMSLRKTGNEVDIEAAARIAADPYDYGVDFSFPIHHYQRGDTPLGQYFKQGYERMIQGCYEKYSRYECDATEQARMEMNMQQTATQHNYTKVGFFKRRVPKEAWEPLINFYLANRDKEKLEAWPRGNTYTNNWESHSTMISFEDRSLRGGIDVKEKIWNGVKPVIEEWVGRKIKPTSLYGIRLYKDKAILNPHVDRMPLVSSCIINVDQDIDEPWPAEVYSHDGKAYNVTMEPGDMVLYESHTTIHGRPFPLKGRFYANIFVHFIPLDHDEQNAIDPTLLPEVQEAARARTKAAKKNTHVHTSKTNGGHEADNVDNETVRRHRERLANSNKESGDRESDDADLLVDKEYEFPGFEYSDESKPIVGRTPLHAAAARGDANQVRRMLTHKMKNLILHAKDENDWQAIHEAGRGGHIETVKLLVQSGADVTTKTKGGGTVLWWAKRILEPGHEVIQYLEDIGAPEEGEDL